MTPKNFTLNKAAQFPDGVAIDAYDAGSFDYFPGVGALGTVVATVTSDEGAATFALDSGRYFFVNQSTPAVYVRGTVGSDNADEYSVAYTEALDLGTPAAAVDDYFVTSVSMKATAYTLAHASSPVVPRNITVTHTAVSTADTLGSLVVTGTNYSDAVITESIALATGTVASGSKAFKTVTSLVTPSWVVASGADSIKVGYGNKLGLDRELSSASKVFATFLNYSGVVPTITVDDDEIEKNTVDLSAGTYNGSKPARVLLLS